MQLRHKAFRGMWKSWASLFDEAAVFATRLGPERVISVSHSCDNTEGVVVVWFWDDNAYVE